MRERDEQRDSDKHEIGDNQRPVKRGAVDGEDDSVDSGERRDQERHEVDDGEPAANGARVWRGARFGEAGEGPNDGIVGVRHHGQFTLFPAEA